MQILTNIMACCAVNFTDWSGGIDTSVLDYQSDPVNRETAAVSWRTLVKKILREYSELLEE